MIELEICYEFKKEFPDFVLFIDSEPVAMIINHSITGLTGYIKSFHKDVDKIKSWLKDKRLPITRGKIVSIHENYFENFVLSYTTKFI